MAGGRGERFWPAGRRNHPKQLLPLLSEKTMIEETVQRLFPLIAPERVFVITNDAYLDKVRSVLPIPPENIIGEPVGRDTAPCVALAAATVAGHDPEGTMILLPADHEIHPAKLFQEILYRAAKQAQSGALVTLGIPPTFPSTGYGYIQEGETVAEGFRRVAAFREKPDEETARRFLSGGNYKWNSGMFIWRADAILAAFRKYAPALADKAEAWSTGADYRNDFAECEKISIDYAVMEKADNVLVGEAPFHWNDIGSWSALRSVMTPDEAGNVCRGNVIAIDSGNNVVLTDEGTLVGVIGMNDIAVVKSGNGILICPLSMEQRVKELVRKIEEKSPESI